MSSSKRFGRPEPSSFKKLNTKFGKSKPKSKAEANVAGYEKRLARKGKRPVQDLNDVYEHLPDTKKTRRSNVTLDLDRDEEYEFSGGLESKTEAERQELRARLVGENVDDEEIASDDDEEIDSDAAFEESDEERFAGFFSSKKRSKAKASQKDKGKSVVRFAEVDLNEDDEEINLDDPKEKDDEDSESEEEEEGDDDEFIDLLDVLDGKGEIDMGSDDDSAKKAQPVTFSSNNVGSDEDDVIEEDDHDDDEEDSEDDDHDEEDEDENENAQMDITPSDDEDAPEALSQLQNFVSGLAVSAKRKSPDQHNDAVDSEAPKARKRRLIIKEHTEAGEENEFRAHFTGTKLNLDDLLAPLSGQSSTLQSLKKSTKILDPLSSSSSKTKAKTLSAPLPQRAQERLDRQAAYEQTKEEVDKWTETMKRIRQAEHLSFPLQADSKGRVSNLELNAKFKPMTEMESAVDALLKSAKMREEDINDTEDTMLKMNNLTVEEVAERRAELRKMRELMFRAEMKAKRVKKIKSKTYRRIKRKEKEKLGEKIDEQDDEEDVMKAELDRARERATLRHKHTGKWARHMKGKEGLDEDTRRDIEDMLARGEKLRRRIKGVGSDEDDEEEESSDEDDDMDGDAGIERIKQGAFDELRKLDDDDDSVDGNEGKSKAKSVFGMKFMKDAMARRALEANREMDDFIEEMGSSMQPDGEASDDGQENMQDLDLSSGILTSKIGGRLAFRPTAVSNKLSNPPQTLATFSDTSSVTLKSTDLLSPPPASPTVVKTSELSRPQEPTNPWLVRDPDARSKIVKKTNEVVVSKDSKFADKSKAKLKKAAQKKTEEKEKAADDAVVEISLNNVLTTSTTTSTSIANITTPSTLTAKEKKKKKKTSVVAKAGVMQKQSAEDDADSDEDVNLEVEAQEQALLKGKVKPNVLAAFEQRDLVSLAFAGDNVVQTFEETKKREVTSDAPREVDTTIPGWGSWGGTGVKKAPPKPQFIKKIAGIDPTTRADYNKKNIIISEKRDKKVAKYLVKDLPYPYTSKAQFERAMERPLGVEWNTRVGFQRATLPKVVKKPGIVINPLEKQHS